MFDSGVTAKNLINSLKSEIDIAKDIDDAVYLDIISTIEQLLYSEIIREQAKMESDLTDDRVIALPENIRFEDVYTVYADENQLIKTNLTSADVFPNVWYKSGENLAYSVDFEPEKIIIIYFVRPEIKTTGEENVMIPYEFLDLVRAKVRGEIYKIVNEDGPAAKWLNDYNVLLETFKAWVQNKAAVFGM